MLDGDRHRCLSVKRNMTGNHLIERNSERIDVRTFIRISSAHLFRRTVMNRSHRVGADRIGGSSSRDTEIRHLDFAVSRNNDILRLNVSVNDPLIMSCRESHCHLNRDTCRFTDRKLSFLGNIFLQRNALNEFHYNIITAFVLSDVIYIDDIRIGKSRSCLGFPSEFGDKCAVALKFRFHDFHSDISVQFLVQCLVDVSHSA